MSANLPDFKILKQMAIDDPEGLEQLRLKKINELIASAPEAYRSRLRGLQFQIDAQRRLAKNPLQACINISRMMHDSFTTLREKLQEASHSNVFQQELEGEFEHIESAKIIAFPTRAR